MCCLGKKKVGGVQIVSTAKKNVTKTQQKVFFRRIEHVGEPCVDAEMWGNVGVYVLRLQFFQSLLRAFVSAAQNRRCIFPKESFGRETVQSLIQKRTELNTIVHDE